MTQIACIENPQVDRELLAGRTKLALIEQIASTNIAERVLHFHQTLPDYQPSPLVSLKNLAHRLGVKNILVKDESQRFDLKAFKLLGASYAMACQLNQRITNPLSKLDFVKIKQQQADYASVEFATATDGNHGRAVAWSAFQFGCAAHVFMPQGSSINRLNAIARYAQSAQILNKNYDETVAAVDALAKHNHWLLMQDTAWPGYEEIPTQIMQGYFTLLKEFECQCDDHWPTHIFLQAGVGSMAAALAAYLVVHDKPTPKIILVEPDKAPCFFQSVRINDGNPHRYSDNMDTIMAGLACGQPSSLAWPILLKTAEVLISCDDAIAIQGMQRYANPFAEDFPIISGESGAVTLGLIEAVMSEPHYRSIRDTLAIKADSTILLLSTEGDTDPQIYQSLVQRPGELNGGM